MSAHGNPYSRFQVLTEGRPAWALGRKQALYYFDGLRFWRRIATGREVLMTSWQCPCYGWLHLSDCDCPLCSTYIRADSHAA
jgi:hypothetical protein